MTKIWIRKGALYLLTCIVILSFIPNTIFAADDSVTLLVDETASNDNALRSEGAIYKTVMGAYAKAKAGDTIQLNTDIITPSNESRVFYKSLTFDFNGHTLSCSYSANTVYGLVAYGGTLTIKDSSQNKTGKLKIIRDPSTNKFLSSGFAATGSGTLLIEDGSVEMPAVQDGDPTSVYGLLAAGGRQVYVNGSFKTNSTAGTSGNGSAVWIEEAAAETFECARTTGTVAIRLDHDLKLTKDQDNGKVSYRINKGDSVTVDLAGHNLTTKNINFIVAAGGMLHITNSASKTSTISNATTDLSNIINYGSLIIDGKVKIINRAESYKQVACIYQQGDNTPPPFRPADGLTHASAVLGKDVVLDANYAAMFDDFSYQETSRITINGSTFKSQRVTPFQAPMGVVEVNEGTFIGPLGPTNARPEGFFAGTNTTKEIIPDRYINTWLENVIITSMKNVSITAQDNGIYFDERIQGTGEDNSIYLSNVTINKNDSKPAKTGIMNLSGKDITLGGKDTYLVCDRLYETDDSMNTTVDNDGNEVPIKFQTPPGNLTITGGIYSVDPSAYVDSVKYAILHLSERPYRDLVAPWTQVGKDNRISLYYDSAAEADALASDQIDIEAMDDVDHIVPTLEAKHFTLSSSPAAYTQVQGLNVTAFKDGKHLTIEKKNETVIQNNTAYVWYGGKSIGKVILEETKEPTFNVSGEITGSSDELPSAKLIRNGKIYEAEVTDNNGSFHYRARVPSGTYNLVVSTKYQSNPVTVTVLITVNSNVVKDIRLPAGEYNSIVTKIGKGTPNIEVGGLDDIAETIGAPTVHTKGFIELIVKENEASLNAPEVKALIRNDGLTEGIMMDLDLFKTINQGPQERITALDQREHGSDLITVIFHLPERLQNKKGYAIYRYHDTKADKITETANPDGEFIQINDDKTIITARLKKFSTYSIAYKEKKKYTIESTSGANGSITPSGSVEADEGENKTFAITPDAGFKIDKVLIDGEQAGAITEYTFKDINDNHSIYAAFKSIPSGPDTTADKENTDKTSKMGREKADKTRKSVQPNTGDTSVSTWLLIFLISISGAMMLSLYRYRLRKGRGKDTH